MHASRRGRGEGHFHMLMGWSGFMLPSVSERVSVSRTGRQPSPGGRV